MAILPFWFSTEHLWSAITPFWLLTDDMSETHNRSRSKTAIREIGLHGEEFAFAIPGLSHLRHHVLFMLHPCATFVPSRKCYLILILVLCLRRSSTFESLIAHFNPSTHEALLHKKVQMYFYTNIYSIPNAFLSEQTLLVSFMDSGYRLCALWKRFLHPKSIHFILL